jgi:hypothetical protein
MSVNATTTSGTSPTNGLKGVVPLIFNGDRSKSDSFWNEFRRYRLLNRKNESISVPLLPSTHRPVLHPRPSRRRLGKFPGSSARTRVDTTQNPHVAETDEDPLGRVRSRVPIRMEGHR